jgi:hypothetical protein
MGVGGLEPEMARHVDSDVGTLGKDKIEKI